MASYQRLHRSRRGDEGLSIIGVVIASFIILVALAPAASVLEATIAVSGNNQHRVVAANLATQQMETIRSQISQQTFAVWVKAYGPTGTAASVPLTPISTLVGTTNYSVATNLSWTAGNFQTGGCSSVTATAASVPPLLQVDVTVSWQNERLAQPVKLTELINAPSSLFNTTSGSILVSVLPATITSSPLPPISVQLFSGTTYISSGSTDQTGCIFFPNLNPSANIIPGPVPYTVVLPGSKNVGYVDQASLPSPSTSVTVSSGQTAGVQFVYDRGATLSVSDPTQSAIASQFGIIANDNYLTSTPGLTPIHLNAASTDPQTYGLLFPATSGYQTWLGTCSSYLPNSSYQTSAGVTPGSTSSIAGLYYSTLNLVLTNSSGLPEPANTSATIYVWQYPSFTATTSCNTPIAMPVTTGTGGTATINVPTGYFGLAATTGTTAPTSPTTAMIDATVPQSVSGPVAVPSIVAS